jgi:hypothetical protein
MKHDKMDGKFCNMFVYLFISSFLCVFVAIFVLASSRHLKITLLVYAPRGLIPNIRWQPILFKNYLAGVRVMVLNATFSNISIISWLSVLLVEETRVPGENHRLAASS